MKQTIKKTNRFESVTLHLASPDDVLSWSFGEVTKPETINYRTQRSEKNGLFDERIFGPEQDFQCSCGKFRGAQYHGIVCDKCGVEITKSAVRRERMGHIELATPICHIWYLRKTPSRIAQLMGMQSAQLQKVIYFSAYLITEVDEDKKKAIEAKLKAEFDAKIAESQNSETQAKLRELFTERVKEISHIAKGNIVDEALYYILSKQYGTCFKGEKGADPIYKILKNMDLKKKEKEVEKELETANNLAADRLKKQLQIIRAFLKSKARPEWMFMTRIPVIPPGIRPLVALDGGRYASSDLNDLYRLVIIRNNRLKNFLENKAPKIFVDTQRRLVQEAVDSLIDNSIQYNTTSAASKSQNRQLKSISEYLGGKRGYFRQNLLGKRVDYSGRSVIVVGPHLNMDQCGLPKEMAIELFRPFIIAELIASELAFNVRGASRFIDDRVEIVWDILERVSKNKYVLLNRQPTLHRQNIQAFKPVLIEGKAIELHPLVCEAYNADFDGDQMAIHLPLSEEAQAEAREFLISTKNIIKPSSGDVNMGPARMDIVLGCYYATREIPGAKGEGNYFSSTSEAITAYDNGFITINAKIKVLPSDKARYATFEGKVFDTTVGRLLFNNILPKEYPYINDVINKSKLKKIVERIVASEGVDKAPVYFDKIKNFGFKYATKSGFTFAWDDLNIPEARESVIAEGYAKTKTVQSNYEEGMISLAERKRKTTDVWQGIRAEMLKAVEKNVSPTSSLASMIVSGARGDMGGFTKMVGMYGVVDSAKGEPIEKAITSSFKEGFNPIEYFTMTYKTRKGMSDTAIKTASAGYLSRKLFDVAQEINVVEENCGSTRGFTIYRASATGLPLSLVPRVVGRFPAEDVVDGKGAVIAKKNARIDLATAEAIEKEISVTQLKLRSPLTCRNASGVCARCYGDDKTTNATIEIGEPVGTIAAQSVGEPGTQLTISSVKGGHTKTGAASSADITAGLPRITEIFDRRVPKALATIARIDGTISSIEKMDKGLTKVIIGTNDKKAGLKDREYVITPNRFVIVKVGDDVKKGDFLTDGSADLNEYLEYAKKEATQEYIFKEVNKVYELQGVNLAPVHFEIIIRQMFSRLVVEDIGDGPFSVGDNVEYRELTKINEELEKKGKQPVKAESKITGIINVSTSRSNFLSAASFQSTTSVLIRAALEGSEDTLDGLKENVIIGRLVPIGSGFKGSKKYDIIEKVREKTRERLLQIENEKASKTTTE